MESGGPDRLVERFVDAWNDGDADALGALFAEDADFVNVVGLWWSSREEIRSAHAYGFTHIFGASTMTLLETRVRDLGDVAVVHARWELDGQQAPDGAPGERRRGVLTFVARQRHEQEQEQGQGGWVVVAAQNTDRLPGSETLLVTGGQAVPASYRAARLPPHA